MGVFDFLQQAGGQTADFLATAGNRTAIGSVGQALGGRTPGQQRRSNFIDNELPVLADQISQATTDADIRKGVTALSAAYLKAGLPPQAFDKFSESLVAQALRGVGASEIAKIGQQLAPTPAQPRPEGTEGPLTESGNFIDPRAGRQYNQADAFKLAEIEARTGVKPPANLAALLTAPSSVESNQAQTASRQASEAKTREEINALQAREKTIEGLPQTPIGDSGVSPRQLGRLGGLGGVVSSLGNQDVRRQGLEIQQQRLQMLADRVAQGSATAGERAELARQRLEFDKQKFEDAKTSQTTADVPYRSIDREVDMAAIAKEAAAQGITDPEGIRALAKKRGVNIEGTPTVSGRPSGITNPYNIFSPPPMLGGDVQLSKQPKVTTRTRGAPSGEQPAPQGGAPAAPKVGTVVRGYRFKGGDPSQQANWEQVQ